MLMRDDQLDLSLVMGQAGNPNTQRLQACSAGIGPAQRLELRRFLAAVADTRNRKKKQQLLLFSIYFNEY